MVLSAITVVPSGLWLMLPGHWTPLLALLHVALLAWLVPPFILMLHCTSHRRLFRTEHRRLGNLIPVILGPFFGQTPFTYFAHHVGMHHPENNLEDDISSTMPYRRDSLVDFLRYLGRFLVLGMLDLARYLGARRRRKILRNAMLGEFAFVAAAVAVAIWGDWRGSVTVLVFPLLLTRVLMMAGNWGQHAFIDAEAPENPYRNSITCVNHGYNRRCFNDGYHISHHLDAGRHWSEHPAELAANEARYRAAGALVFDGLDFNGVFLLLMRKRYDLLAARVVRLAGDTRSNREIAAVLEERARPIVRTGVVRKAA